MAVDLTKHDVPAAGRETCFLCGQDFDTGELGQEHVFAKWLQGKFNLWDRTLVLLNGTQIPYRNLKIPACGACNNVSLSKVEGQIARALPGGAAEIRSRTRDSLSVGRKTFLWHLVRGSLVADEPRSRRSRDDSETGCTGRLSFHAPDDAGRSNYLDL